MNLIQQAQFNQRVATDAALTEPNAVAMAAVLLSFVNRDSGRCDPGIMALCIRMRRGPEAVRKALKALVEAGHIDIHHRFNQTNEYVLKLKEVVAIADSPPSAPPTKSDLPPTKSEPPPPTENRLLTGRQKDSIPDPETRSVRDVAWLVKRWQQLADKPGWRMPHAFAAVTAAIKHAGFAAVERLYFELKDGGKRAAYWLAQELRTLGPAPVPVPASPPAAAPTVPEVLPTEALGHVNEARLRISDALTNPPLWRRIVAAIEAIGLVPARQYEPHLVEKQLALALSRGQSVRT